MIGYFFGSIGSYGMVFRKGYFCLFLGIEFRGE